MKEKIVHLHLEDDYTIKSIVFEFGVSKTAISKWCSEFSKEFQISPEMKEEFNLMQKIRKLRKENEELKKENEMVYGFYVSVPEK